MFSRARWRLAVWFAGVVAVIIVLIGGAVFLTARRALFDQVNDDLVARAQRESRPLAERLLDPRPPGNGALDIGPAFTAGGYFYALADRNGNVLASTANVDPAGLPAENSVQEAIDGGSSFVDTKSSQGERLRVYVLPLGRGEEPRFVFEVGRSTEPERDALRRLLLVLLGGGGAAMLLAVGGGFILAGRALRPIESAMDKQRAFVADASHELRTPLSLIRANAEILEREASKPVNANLTSVEDIIGETDRLSALVGQMLTLAQAEAGNAELRKERVDLAETAAETARQMRLLAGTRGISVEATVSGSAIVSGDPARLQELVTILLDNAIKYSDDDSTVRVIAHQDGQTVILEIADNGRGIPPEALSRIFDRFYRVDTGRSRDMGGTGLGLSIAKWIVEAHNGAISVDSTQGAGTTVRVTLPAARAATLTSF